MTYNILSTLGEFTKMALADRFGETAYSCAICGYGTAMYEPHCPKCLNQSLCRVQKGGSGGPVGRVAEDDGKRLEEKAGIPPLGIAAAVLVLALVVYAFFAQQSPEVQQEKADTYQDQVDAAAKRKATAAANARIANQARIRRRAAARAAAVQSAAASRPKPVASSAPAPRRAAPMKLWQVSRDDESDE